MTRGRPVHRYALMTDLRSHWTLDPAVTFLNHGSYGACPVPVLARQAELRARVESEPVRFFKRELEPLLDEALESLARFLHAHEKDLAVVPNATAGVNTVLRSLAFREGDELLVTDHAYGACRNAIDFVAERAGAKVVVAQIPFPIRSPAEVIDRVLEKAGPRTRLALIDHITSPTALVFPIAELVKALAARGIDTLVDGAHGPGQVAIDLTALGAAYYAGNCHKWLCAPKGAGFLHVREDKQREIRPLSISHGATSQRGDRSRFRLEFDWQGTFDATAFLSIPEAIRFLGGLLPGGWAEVRSRNHALALAGRDALCRALELPPPAPDGMLGSMAAIALPGRCEPEKGADPLQDTLFFEHHLEVPITPWFSPRARLLRISAQLYNQEEDYERLAKTLPGLLAAER